MVIKQKRTMKRKKESTIASILLVIMFLFLSGCTENEPQPPLTYVNEDYGFGLNPPEGWTINLNTSDPVKFFCPDQNDYQVHIAVKKPVLSNDTLEDAVNQLIEFYTETFFENFALISSQSKQINGLNAYELVYSEGRQPNLLQHKQMLFEKVNGTYIYTLTYIALVRDYNRYVSVVDQCINSFTLF